MLAGIRVAHYPDPTDAAGLVRTVAAYNDDDLGYHADVPELHVRHGRAEDLASLRIIVSRRGEMPRCPLRAGQAMAPHAFILEGYGITECSPVVAGNLPGRDQAGHRRAARGRRGGLLVDPDSHRAAAHGAAGMLLVRGPSIFNGYLNYSGPDPFTEVDGKRWYVTGDLVRLDDDGYIHFCGRLKRFLKIGGEMVSLPALEEPLARASRRRRTARRWRLKASTPRPGGSCFSPRRKLRSRRPTPSWPQAGLRGVMRLDAVQHVDAIPVLGHRQDRLQGVAEAGRGGRVARLREGFQRAGRNKLSQFRHELIARLSTRGAAKM